MRFLTHTKTLGIGMLAVAIVLTATSGGLAQGMSRHGDGPRMSEGNRDSGGQHEGGPERHHDGDWGGHNHGPGSGRGIKHSPYYFRYPHYYSFYPYYYYPYYNYSAPPYWYYCPSYGTYYPYVESCPEAWVPVPAS